MSEEPQPDLEARAALRSYMSKVETDRELLWSNIEARRSHIDALRSRARNEWGVEDTVYRYYHGSFKVFHAQEFIHDAVELFGSMLPGRPLCRSFECIVTDALSKRFNEKTTNLNWEKETRPIIEALFHCCYFLGMMSRYSRIHDAPQGLLASGEAAVMSLYGVR